VTWQASILAMVALLIVGGFAWFERSRPSARIVAAVAALAALGVAGRLVLAPVPNLVATTDVALLAGYTLGGGPGFVVGALSGLVSNFWLGQGPWTPWQMAGWGLVGIGGAMLARFSGRRLGRLGLAGVAGLAGLAYGALLDLSVMVNYGGEQSLDRYLALSARGIPFNLVHAAGNAALMLAAGPALVRMLDRYRERFEVRWSDVPLAGAAAGVALALCVALPLLAPPAGSAADGRLGARGWLVKAQNGDGGFGISADDESSVGMTGWAMLGLEAAGLNPADVTAGGKTPIQFMRANVSAISSTADLERTILALEAAGVDSRNFAGQDLVAKLRDRQGGDGSFERQVNLTAFGILAQRSAGVPGENYGKAAAWLRGIQNKNGGWGSTKGAESEPDSTGAVLQALAVSPGGTDEVQRAGRWLGRSQHNDGGWSLTRGTEANAQSTAWAIQGLLAAGRDPGNVDTKGNTGFDFLSARQGDDGHYAYSAASDQTPVWVTAQGLTAVAREPFPLPVAKRKPEGRAGEKGGEGTATGSGGGGSASGGTPAGPAVPTGGSGEGGPFDFGAGAGGVGPRSRGGSAEGAKGPGEGSRQRGGAPPMQSIPPLPKEESSEIAAPATPVAATDPGGAEAPPTWALLAGLALLAAALGAGFVWYRDRLP